MTRATAAVGFPWRGHRTVAEVWASGAKPKRQPKPRYVPAPKAPAPLQALKPLPMPNRKIDISGALSLMEARYSGGRQC